jgi:hypothetical protein
MNHPLQLDLLGASSITCARHREALAELAERAEPTLAGAAALAHLERCRDCADTLGDLTLTVVALRRLGSEAAPDTTWFAWPAASPPAPAPDDALDRNWSHLRERIERSRQAAREQAWRWRASFGGLLASAFVVAALVGPGTLHLGGAAGLAPAGGPDIDAVSQQIESDYVNGARAPLSDPSSVDLTDGSVGVRRYPDDLKPVRKEVAPPRSSALSPDAR